MIWFWLGLFACRTTLAPLPGDSQGQESSPPVDSPMDSVDSPPYHDTVEQVPGDTLRGDTEIEDIPGLDPLAELFSDDEIQEFHIELPSASFDALAADPYTWVEGAFTYGDLRYDPVAVRIKGENSYEPIDAKPSLKVKFDAYTPGGNFMGLSDLTLNNMNNDYSMMHERVAYRMFREAGLPASRAMHALVTVNDQPYGLYTNLETVDKHFLAEWFEDPSGPLFEVWDTDFWVGWEGVFEHEAGDEDRTAITGLAAAMALGGEAALEEAQVYLDLDQFITWWAAEGLIGQFDSYPFTYPGDDCHIYMDPGDGGRIHFIPWGMDETFYYPTNNIQSVYGILATTCLSVEWCEEQMEDEVWRLYEIHETIPLGRYAQEVSEQIREAVEDDDNKIYSTSYVFAYQADMRRFIQTRGDSLESFIGPAE